MFTARYLNASIDKKLHTPIRISQGEPKFALPYRISSSISMLMPKGKLIEETNYEIFFREYTKQLDEIGIKEIHNTLLSRSEYGKKIVLLCFEDIRKANTFCHRRIFADWWEEKTRNRVDELPELSPVQYTMAEKKAIRDSLYSKALF